MIYTKDILILISVFLYLWIVFGKIRKKGESEYVRKYKQVTATYLIASALAILMYFPQVSLYIRQLNAFSFFYLLGFHGFLLLSYHFGKRIVNKKAVDFFTRRHMLYVTIDYRYLLAKSFDILFQQICIYAIVSLLLNFHIPPLYFILCTGLIGLISHSYLMAKHKTTIWLGIYFTSAGCAVGILFPILALYSKNAFIYTYSIHWLFYLISGILANVAFPKISNVFQIASACSRVVAQQEST